MTAPKEPDSITAASRVLAGEHTPGALALHAFIMSRGARLRDECTVGFNETTPSGDRINGVLCVAVNSVNADRIVAAINGNSALLARAESHEALDGALRVALDSRANAIAHAEALAGELAKVLPFVDVPELGFTDSAHAALSAWKGVR